MVHQEHLMVHLRLLRVRLGTVDGLLVPMKSWFLDKFSREFDNNSALYGIISMSYFNKSALYGIISMTYSNKSALYGIISMTYSNKSALYGIISMR